MAIGGIAVGIDNRTSECVDIPEHSMPDSLIKPFGAAMVLPIMLTAGLIFLIEGVILLLVTLVVEYILKKQAPIWDDHWEIPFEIMDAIYNDFGDELTKHFEDDSPLTEQEKYYYYKYYAISTMFGRLDPDDEDLADLEKVKAFRDQLREDYLILKIANIK